MSKKNTTKRPKPPFNLLLLMATGGLILILRGSRKFNDVDIDAIVNGAIGNIIALVVGIPISLKIYELQQHREKP